MAVALIFSGVLLPVRAAAGALSLTVSYEAKCGVPSVFTVRASGGSGNYQYYLGNITRDGEDGQYFVMDPSRLPGYKTDNTFEFTFCASGVYYLHFYVMDKGVSPIVTKRTIVQVTLNDPSYPTVEAIADRVAAQCRENCQTEYERALWLHDWLVDHCTYDYSLLYCGSEGALARGKGTCESYHRAYTMLLNRVGIANGRMEGNGHVWTAVRMDGSWYQVDVTWDDNGYSNHTYENYLYFGLNDTLMKLVHSDHSPHSGYISDALANHYLIRSGTIRRWSDPLMEPVQQNLQAGKTSFVLPVAISLPGSNQDVVYGLAAYQLSMQKWSTATHTVQLQASYSAGQMQVDAAYTPIVSTTESSSSQGGSPSSAPSVGPGPSSSQGGSPSGAPSVWPGPSSSQGGSPSGAPSVWPGTSSSQGGRPSGATSVVAGKSSSQG
ncbi:MAG: transglutaminase domain-containing protein, partial [Clostridiales bacterium]|nr:transglutaminase domain-containing protein [Clostridiales bacterium]